MDVRKIFLRIRPIVFSALFLFITAWLAQISLSRTISGFDILASKDLGKIVFTLLVFAALGIFVAQQPSAFVCNWRKQNFGFLTQKKGAILFAKVFTIFFSLHALLLASFYLGGVAYFSPSAFFSLKAFGQIVFGFFVTFMLAYTEEVMFRGTVFPYLLQFVRPIVAIFFTALMFMIAHFLPNPLIQLARDPAIAFGLFLLGFMLNLIFVAAGTMYANIGAHAGLVFVKVILRKVRFLVISTAPTLPWFLHHDLRQAPLVHGLFLLVIIGLMVWYRKILFSSKTV